MADLKYLQSAKLTIDNTKVLYLKSTTNPDGMNFDFSITRERYKILADINMVIYNISADTLKLLNKRDPNSSGFKYITPIKLEAGYRGKNKLIFNGTVFFTETSYSLGEKITQIQISDYSSKFWETKISKEYREAPKLSEALTDFANAAGLKVNINISGSDDKKVSQKSYTGSLIEFFKNEIVANEKIYGNIRNDILYVYSTSVSKKSSIKTINAKNGMILTPTRTQDNLVRVNTVFDPDYFIDMPVQIESTKFEQPRFQGQIFKFTHNMTPQLGLSIADILPDGQAAPQPNIGVI